MTTTRLSLALLLCLTGCRGASVANEARREPAASATAAPTARVGTQPGRIDAAGKVTPNEGRALAIVAGGCFWGVEDVFRHVPGVTATAVGYTGGHTEKPTYEEVCGHGTGHAEAVLVEFDPAKVTYDELLDVFFEAHDPTQRNRQGPDVGDQYRSAVFTRTDAEAAAARAAIARAQRAHEKPVVTEVTPLGAFTRAEGYHQQYAERTGRHSCPLPASLKKKLGMEDT